jgi:hypothetical protein
MQCTQIPARLHQTDGVAGGVASVKLENGVLLLILQKAG